MIFKMICRYICRDDPRCSEVLASDVGRDKSRRWLGGEWNIPWINWYRKCEGKKSQSNSVVFDWSLVLEIWRFASFSSFHIGGNLWLWIKKIPQGVLAEMIVTAGAFAWLAFGTHLISITQNAGQVCSSMAMWEWSTLMNTQPTMSQWVMDFFGHVFFLVSLVFLCLF